jgi:polyferredoxin
MGRKSAGRKSVQIFFFLFAIALSFAHLAESGSSAPRFSQWRLLQNFHALCPFGAVETAGRLVFQGRFVQKTGYSNLWAFAGALAGAALLGPGLCSYLCPLGSLQEWVGALGKRVFGKRHNRFVPKGADRALGYLRYAVLAFIVVQTTRLVSLVFSRFDPYYALLRFWSGEVHITALVVLGAVLAASLFTERPWCRWLCPLGGLLGLAQLLSPWKIRVTKSSCTSCGACGRACPMNAVFRGNGVVRDLRCNRCGACLSACAGHVTHSLPFKTRLSIKQGLAAGILFMAVFMAPSLYAIATGKMVRPGEIRPGGRSGVKVAAGNAAAERVLD